MTRKQQRHIRLGAHFPGVNNHTVWSDPQAGSHIEFSSFRHFARTAERGKFDFLFLAEGLRLREQAGKIYDLDVVGRPNNLAILSALAAVTSNIGLAATVNSTFNEPYEIARQFATLNSLSNGRAAWNVVTSWDAFTGENFRRGGFLPQEQRYTRAQEFLEAVQHLIGSPQTTSETQPSSLSADIASSPPHYTYNSEQFTIQGRFPLHYAPDHQPVIFQAGDSDQGREFAAHKADAIFTRHNSIPAGQAFYTDVKQRLSRYQRSPEELLILPAATFVLADTDEDAHEKARHVSWQQFSGQTAVRLAEQIWNTDLSHLDPDGPLPDYDPIVADTHIVQGRASTPRNPAQALEASHRLRSLAAKGNYSLRESIIAMYSNHSFVGSPQTIADKLIAHVEARACDGFILVPHLTPGGFDDFVDQVVPLLQEKGVFREEYLSTNLHENLGLPPRKNTFNH